MSILIFANIKFPEGFADTAHNALMVRGLRENNESSFLLIPYSPKKDKISDNYMLKGHLNGIPYFYLDGNISTKIGETMRMYIGMFKASKLIFRRWKKKRGDIVIIYLPVFFKHLPIIITCWLFRIPLYPWQVEKMTTLKRNKGFKGGMSYISYYLNETLLPFFSKGIIVISTYLKEYYSKFFKNEEILISPILVDPQSRVSIKKNEIDLYKLKYKDKKLIVYSGTFEEKDGFPYILQAIKLLVKEIPNCILVCTGKFGKYNPIENTLYLVEEYGIKNNFIYLGVVSKKELQLLNNAADLLLVCRSNSEFANYGFPWKLGEYCMTSNPIIATNVGDIDKYFIDGENLLIAKPEDPLSIYMKMKLIFGNYEQAKIIAKRGYEKAYESFDYSKETNKIISFIKRQL